MNTGGVNGDVSICTNAGGTTIKVKFPAIVGPPAQSAHEDVYAEPSAALMRRFENAVAVVADVVVDGTGNPTQVTAHK